jgi:hypothetical protein
MSRRIINRRVKRSITPAPATHWHLPSDLAIDLPPIIDPCACFHDHPRMNYREWHTRCQCRDRVPAACRKNWARLIRRIYEVDPLTCPICRGTLRIISTIEEQGVIKSILNHLALRIAGSRPLSKAHAPPVHKYVADGSCSAGIPNTTSYGDPCHSWDAYITA